MGVWQIILSWEEVFAFKMKRIVLITLAFAFLGCNKAKDCVSSWGNSKVAVQELEPFNKVECHTHYDIEFYAAQGMPQKVELVAGDHMIDGFKLTVKEGTLHLEDENICNFVRSFDHRPLVRIYTDSLQELTIEGDVKVTFLDTMTVDRFKLSHDSNQKVNLKMKGNRIDVITYRAAQLKLEGKVTELFATLQGTSNFDARKLETAVASVDQFSPVDCVLNATVKYIANIYNKGNVYYTQAAQLELKEKTGTGDLLPLP